MKWNRIEAHDAPSYLKHCFLCKLKNHISILVDNLCILNLSCIISLLFYSRILDQEDILMLDNLPLKHLAFIHLLLSSSTFFYLHKQGRVYVASGHRFKAFSISYQLHVKRKQ
jgi:hypothetical protein